MIFIASAWSPNMVVDDHLLVDFHKIDERTFRKYCEYAHSCMNKTSLANILGIKFNPEHVQLRAGDTLIAVHVKGGKMLAYMDELPDNVVLEFYCYTVYNPDNYDIRKKRE